MEEHKAKHEADTTLSSGGAFFSKYRQQSGRLCCDKNAVAASLLHKARTVRVCMVSIVVLLTKAKLFSSVLGKFIRHVSLLPQSMRVVWFVVVSEFVP